ncbi:MAG: monovalent cation/H(+) antiporter subunit G [Candidatus Thermoplasmatota archaeon]|jgi:multicomponent Na+:H+ antiporter subunit G|nr:monovalent cation/H(+) antiporter subunit G [Candidatus Thermoplasmatota archaeon]
MIFDIIIYIFLGIGVFFNVLAGIGLLRFPDVYTRLHAGTKCTTFGSIFIIGSVILIGFKMWWEGNVNGSILSIHSIFALIAILLTNPVGAHAIARAAHRSGVMPARAIVDDLKDKQVKKETRKTTSEEKNNGGQ